MIVHSEKLAYIAGFLDGDGSIMVQVKRRSEKGKIKHRIMCTICFYQKSENKDVLGFIQNTLKSGYLCDRKDNISELRINGYQRVLNILKSLLIYLHVKKKIALVAIEINKLLIEKRLNDMNNNEKMFIIDSILNIHSQSSKTHKKRNKEELIGMLIN